MSAPVKHPYIRIVQALLVFVALVLILNPELRALLLLTNAIGFDVAIVLLVLQLRALFALVTPETLRPLSALCRVASHFGYLALVAYPRVVSFDLLNRLLCPALITVSYGLSCQPSNHRWRGP